MGEKEKKQKIATERQIDRCLKDVDKLDMSTDTRYYIEN